jgi:outer membrane protein assembly factor BamA
MRDPAALATGPQPSVALVHPPALAAETVEAAASRTVKVVFEGNQDVPNSDLAAVVQVDKSPAALDEPSSFSLAVIDWMLNQISGAYGSPGPSAWPVSDGVARDALRIQSLYYDRGYVTAKVDPSVSLSDGRSDSRGGRRSIVRFHIEEGSRYKIGKVTATSQGEGPPLPAAELQDVPRRLSLRTGDWFNRGVILADLNEIRARYLDAGYAGAFLYPAITVDPAACSVDIETQVDRGPLVAVERVVVVGNTQMSTDAILKIINIAAGQVFNGTQVSEAQARLRDSDRFDSVDVNASPGPSPTRWTVTFEVHER